MRILVIDNSIQPDSWGSKELREIAAQVPGATVYVRRGPGDDLPKDPSRFDRIVVSGSKTSAEEDAPWISHEEEFVRKFLDLGKPFLGVCYGHQILARVLGGKSYVRNSSAHERGWTQIELTAPSALFKGLPEVFHSFSFHGDEVTKLPPGTRQLARSEGCEIQAMQVGEKPIYGIQFHPERNLETATQMIQDIAVAKKLPGILRAKDGQKLYDAKVGATIFGNFFNL